MTWPPVSGSWQRQPLISILKRMLVDNSCRRWYHKENKCYTQAIFSHQMKTKLKRREIKENVRMCISANKKACNFSSLSCPKHIYLTQENILKMLWAVHVAQVMHFLITRKEVWQDQIFITWRTKLEKQAQIYDKWRQMQQHVTWFH